MKEFAEYSFSVYHWVIFTSFLILALFLDLFVFNKNQKEMTFKKAGILSITWFVVACLFGVYILFSQNEELALEYFTAYIIELTLSIDNVFVFILIFKYLKINKAYQHKILFYGITSAIVMRFIMIIVGVELFDRFEILFFIFGAILILSAIRFMFMKDDHDSAADSGLVKLIKKVIPVKTGSQYSTFFVKENGKTYATILFIALLLIEKADLVFAIDSIPAVLAVTKSAFIVFSSNMLAILGLRSLYMILSSMMVKLYYLKHGVSLILLGVGIKMILLFFNYHINSEYFLLMIASIITISIMASYKKMA